MASIGKTNSLRVVRFAPPGLYLDGGPLGEILLPRRYIAENVQTGDELTVFIYRDSEDRLVATTETPKAQVGEFAVLRVNGVRSGLGAFLDWGLEKDLLLHNQQQLGRPRIGEDVVAYVMVDEVSQRIVATARLNKWLDLTLPNYKEGQQVKLILFAETPLGYKAIVNQAHTGLLYRSELGTNLQIGQQMDGFVRTVRTDGKLDLGLDPVGYQRIKPLTETILEKLRAQGGTLPYHDQSSPEEIRTAFGVSKKAFKQAIGSLYREQRIELAPDGIRLVNKPAPKPKPAPKGGQAPAPRSGHAPTSKPKPRRW